MIREADFEHITKRIVALYDPDAIFVFGSYAKGTMLPRSDLDLVIVRPTEVPRRLRGRDVAAMLAQTPFDFDLLFVTPRELEEELREPYSLMATVMPTAKLIYRREVG